MFIKGVKIEFALRMLANIKIYEKTLKVKSPCDTLRNAEIRIKNSVTIVFNN